MERLKTLKDHVYDYIADQIRVGALRPEEKINENEICEKLGISRTPVREALIQLAAEGVINNNARRGFVVKKTDVTTVMELYEIIGVLEGLAAGKACSAMTENDLKNMQFYIDAMDLAIKSGNYEMYHSQQFLFHQMFIDRCGSASLIDCIDIYKRKLLKQTYVDDPEGVMRGLLLQTNEEHRKILQLLREKNTCELMRYLYEVHWREEIAELDLIV